MGRRMHPPAEPPRVDEVASFLSRFPPFRDLSAAELEDLAAGVGVRSYPAGTTLLQQGAEPAPHLFVVRRGAVELLEGREIVDHLGEGEIFGLSVFSGLGPVLSARASRETECYLIDADPARTLLGSAAGLAFLAGAMAMWREQVAVEKHVSRAGVDDGLVAEIGSASDQESLAASSRRLPSLIRSLLSDGIDPVDIGHVIGMTIDHLTVRLIELFVEERGDPPAAFSWIALGSAARHEQALTTDQDHAISYDDRSDPETIDPYFAALATAVADGLERCGITRCRGNVMAENPAWRRTKEGWRRRFGEYITDPDPMGARISGIAFDYRRVTGAVDIEATLDRAIRNASSDPGFLRRLAATVLESHPPVGRFRDIVVEHGGEHAGTIDIKHGGITIVINLARFYAIRAGLTDNHTVDRLSGAASTGVIADRTRNDLVDAFRLLWRVRLEHHAERVESNARPDDFVDPESLPPVTLAALGASLRVIADAQAGLAKEQGLGRRRG